MDFIGALFGWLPASIEAVLVWLTKTTGSAGIGIILLTILIRLILFPLTKKQTTSMAAMKELQPQLKAIQDKYKNNPQEAQKRIMQLYQEKGVNPLSGCFPVLVQLPFLFALFTVLRDFSLEGFDPTFLIWQLNEPDSYYVLPILSAATTYFQSSLTITDDSQKAIMYIMPIFIGWISLNFQAGLVLYWVVSNLFSIGQHFVITKQMPAKEGGEATK